MSAKVLFLATREKYNFIKRTWRMVTSECFFLHFEPTCVPSQLVISSHNINNYALSFYIYWYFFAKRCAKRKRLYLFLPLTLYIQNIFNIVLCWFLLSKILVYWTNKYLNYVNINLACLFLYFINKV